MKKLSLKLIILAFVVISTADAKCRYRPCDSNIISAELQAEFYVQPYFEALSQAINEADDAYSDYKRALKDEKDLLEHLQKVKKENLLLNEEIFFLIEQGNRITGKEIDLTNKEKDLR